MCSDSYDLRTRLQLTKEIKISTSCRFLSCFSSIWQNPHWFEEPFGTLFCAKDVQLTPSQLGGLEKIRRSLIQFSIEFDTSSIKPHTKHATDAWGLNKRDGFSLGPVTRFSGLINSSFQLNKSTIALHDVLSRLLCATQEISQSKYKHYLQVVVETKQIFGFFSTTEICLMRSSRALRRLLWNKNMKFRSLFGHSGSIDPSVNLSPDDFSTLSDVGANFPGCVRWISMLEQGGLSERSRRVLHRLREFIIFHGHDEIIAFLNLLIDIVRRFSQLANVNNENESSVDRYIMESGLDITWTKRILANFPFRESSLRVPKSVWEGPIGNQKWFLRLQCCLLPSSQHLFFQGISQAVENSSVEVNFTLSQSTIDTWSPLSTDIVEAKSEDLRLPQTLLHVFPEVFQWIQSHGLLSRLVYHPEQKNPKFLQTSVLALPSFNPTSLSDNHPFVNTEDSKTNDGAQEFALLNHYPQTQIQAKKRVGSAPSLSSFLKKMRVPHSLKIEEGPRIIPCLVSGNQTMEKIRPPDLFSVDRIWNSLSLNYRQALMMINDVTVLFVGPFPFTPSMISIPFNELFATYHHFLAHVDYIIVSSTISSQELSVLKDQKSCSTKLRTLFWFLSFFQKSLNLSSIHLGIEENKEKDFYSLLTDVSWNILFEWILPKFITLNNCHLEKSSRNVFFWVPNFVMADLVSPLAHNPLTHILLNTSNHTLRARLWQMSEKQRQWESITLNELSKYSGQQLHTLRSTVLSKCPSFLVHLLFILPVDQKALNQDSCPSIFFKHFNTAQDLQKEFPFHSPRSKIVGEKNSYKSHVPSRLLLWCLPLDFIKQAYMVSSRQQLVELLHQFQQFACPTGFLSKL